MWWFLLGLLTGVICLLVFHLLYWRPTYLSFIKSKNRVLELQDRIESLRKEKDNEIERIKNANAPQFASDDDAVKYLLSEDL